MILINGIPKTGTQLTKYLTVNVLGYEGRTAYIGGLLEAGTAKARVEKLNQALNDPMYGMYTCHCPHSATVARWLKRKKIKCVHVMRDPRDQVVSYFYWIRSSDRNPYHALFANLSDAEALEAMIVGVGEGQEKPRMEPNAAFPSLRIMYEMFASWRDEAGVFTIRYEDIVGPRGHALNVVGQLATYLDVDTWEPKALQDALDVHGVTYRRGVVGGWKDDFDDRHRRAYDRVMGNLAYALGYGWQ